MNRSIAEESARITFGVIAMLIFLMLLYINFFPNLEYHEVLISRGGEELLLRTKLFSNAFFLFVGGVFTYAFIKFDKI